MSTMLELHTKARENLYKTCEMLKAPLGEDQKLAIAGALCIWLEKAYAQGLHDVMSARAAGGSAAATDRRGA